MFSGGGVWNAHFAWFFVLFGCSCERRLQAYVLEDGYSGPVVVVFGVATGRHSSDARHEVGPSGVAIIADPFEAGPVAVYERKVTGPVLIPESDIDGLRSSVYTPCDSLSGDQANLRAISFFVARRRAVAGWQRKLEEVRLRAFADALDKSGRAVAAECAERESRSVR